MKNHFLHRTHFKSLIATLFLGLFLFANYGVNFTDLHQHEHHSLKENEKSKNAHSDCYICDFQGLSYEPLAQKIGFTAHHTIAEDTPVFEYFVLSILSEYHHAIQQRGPPSMGA